MGFIKSKENNAFEEVNKMSEVKITTYDRLLRAWENSMELVRDYEMYSKRIEEEDIKQLFSQFAEDEGRHASILHDKLQNMQH